MPKPASVISVENLTVKAGDLVILDQLSFSIAAGEFTVIIGPNGAGKTVLIKTILGLITPVTGQITLSVPPHQIGYVPQRLEFDPNFPLTVRELMLLKLELPFWFGRSRREREIQDALRLTHSDGLINRPVGKLSGGELQRVLLAYALLKKPALLFLDEPAAGVDVVGEHTFYELIDQIRHRPTDKQHVTVIMISHDLDVVNTYADQVLCLNRRLFCKGIPKKILTSQMLGRVYGHHTGVFEHRHASHEDGESRAA